jgi:hypothetical protein
MASIHYDRKGVMGVHSYTASPESYRLSCCLPQDPDRAERMCLAILEAIAKARELSKEMR